MATRDTQPPDSEMEGIPTDFDDLKPSEFGLDWGDIVQIREELGMTPAERLISAQNLINMAIRNQNGR